MPNTDDFADLLAANASVAEDLRAGDIEGRAAKGLLVLTCMDSRLDPLRMLGLAIGDAKVLRNAGGRVTGDVLATLVLAHYLLDVSRVMVVQHTRCKMASGSEADVHAAVAAAGGPDIRSLTFLTATDQDAAVRADVQRVRSWPYVRDLGVGGFVFDVETGRVRQVC